MDVHASDLVTVLLLVALEGLLSADNAIVLAILVLGLPRRDHAKALRYGLVGAFAFRIIVTLLAAFLIRLTIVKLIGALYLLYLTYQHFSSAGEAADRRKPPTAMPWLGMSAFWATVVKVELTNLVFSIDSILVAVAMSPKMWVILSGGILGIIMMRVVIGQLMTLVQRYPALVDGAFVIIAWVGIKLLIEYVNSIGLVEFDVPKWLSLGLVVVIFAIALVYAIRQGPAPEAEVEDDATKLLAHHEGG